MITVPCIHHAACATLLQAYQLLQALIDSELPELSIAALPADAPSWADYAFAPDIGQVTRNFPWQNGHSSAGAASLAVGGSGANPKAITSGCCHIS
jgi:hypothetical protein